MFGKPNVLVNTQGFKFGNYVNLSLGKFSVEELILMAEQCSSGSNARSTVMRKIFDQIEREKNENEYNRTEIQDRSSMLNNTLQRF